MSNQKWINGMRIRYVGFLIMVFLGVNYAAAQVSGEERIWHPVTIDFEGPATSEQDAFNPFMNYRLNVTFTHEESGARYQVPGYFAADGDAANTSATSGSVWRVHFTPDREGAWQYRVDFRRGDYAAISQKKDTGKSGAFMDGQQGSFTILPTNKQGRDFRAHGRLEYIGEHYLRFAGSGRYFLKSGPDAPENFLAYSGFDGTFKDDGHKDALVKDWAAHGKDWRENDPLWQGKKGKAIIGALNYLASEGLNSVSFLTMNIGGDDRNVFPYVDYETWDRMDVSKLAQWEIVFSHAQSLGIFLHFKLMEHENQGLLDNGAVGAYTKLYYREMVARFGHHLALNWNVCEESGEWGKLKTPPQDTAERIACAEWMHSIDPYHHHLVIHNGKQFHDLLGNKSYYTGPSIQTNQRDFKHVPGAVLRWRELSAKAGKKWAVAVDEPGDASFALVPDASDPEGINHFDARKNALWGTLLSGGWGVEWYFGYKVPHSDLTCRDYRSRDRFWDYCRFALQFFEDHEIAFWKMEPMPNAVEAGFCLGEVGQAYVVYLPEGAGRVQLAKGTYQMDWYNPRNGVLSSGEEVAVKGSSLSIQKPPASGDWVVWLRRTDG